MKIYIASSWRNEHQPRLVRMLRSPRHQVYDFRHPMPGNDGFHWSEIDPKWQDWTPEEYRQALRHPVAGAGFALDSAALQWCDLCILVLPSGRSAHAEYFWAIGRGKHGIIFVPEPIEPELMYLLGGHICVNCGEIADEVMRLDKCMNRLYPAAPAARSPIPPNSGAA